MPTRLPHRGCGGGGHTRRHDHHTIHKTHPPYTPLSTIKGAAHFDTHHVGCVEGRVARRCGGEGTRANTINQPFTKPIHHTHHSQPSRGAAHFDTRHVGCVEGRVARPTPTRSPHHSPNPSTIHTTHNHQGGSSLRHPSCGVCGRESCQALWGGGHPRQHDHATVHNTHPPYTPLTTIKLAAHFDTHHVGCAEGRIARRCVGGVHPRQHDKPTTHTTHLPYREFINNMGAAHFDTHHVGCVEGRVARRCGGRAPAPTR